jgi:hypothetical protein
MPALGNDVLLAFLRGRTSGLDDLQKKATALEPPFFSPSNIQLLRRIILDYTRLQVPEKRPLAPTAGV